jgi:hypothetical protein
MITDADLEALTPYGLEDLIKRANRILLKKIYGFKSIEKTTNELRKESF